MTAVNNINVEMMTWPEYESRIKSGCTVFIPVGAHEQHGPHLPLATDAIFAQEISERVAVNVNGIVLPVVRYGYKSQARSGGGQTFNGTISLDGATLTNQVLDILRELARHGASRCVVVNGHYENQWFLTEAIELLQRELKLMQQNMTVLRTEYWDHTPQSVYDDIFASDSTGEFPSEFPSEFPGVDLEHAALIETSMMLYLHPEYVKKDLIPDHELASFPAYDSYPQTGDHVPADGVLAPAGTASTDKGRLIVETICTEMTKALKQAFPF